MAVVVTGWVQSRGKEVKRSGQRDYLWISHSARLAFQVSRSQRVCRQLSFAFIPFQSAHLHIFPLVFNFYFHISLPCFITFLFFFYLSSTQSRSFPLFFTHISLFHQPCFRKLKKLTKTEVQDHSCINSNCPTFPHQYIYNHI